MKKYQFSVYQDDLVGMAKAIMVGIVEDNVDLLSARTANLAKMLEELEAGDNTSIQLLTKMEEMRNQLYRLDEVLGDWQGALADHLGLELEDFQEADEVHADEEDTLNVAKVRKAMLEAVKLPDKIKDATDNLRTLGMFESREGTVSNTLAHDEFDEDFDAEGSFEPPPKTPEAMLSGFPDDVRQVILEMRKSGKIDDKDLKLLEEEGQELRKQLDKIKGPTGL